MLAMPDRPDDAKGRPETEPANATSGEPSASEQEIDRSRAAERGRGRQATSPRRIPWQGWKDILWRAYEKMNDNRLLAVAAGVVFYALLALFPAVTAFVSLYGLVADASTIDRHLSLASGILPSGAVDILHEQLTRLTSNRVSALSFGFVSGLLFALWSANSGTKAVIDGLNVAYGETEKRSFHSPQPYLPRVHARRLSVVDAGRRRCCRRSHCAYAPGTGRRGGHARPPPPLASCPCVHHHRPCALTLILCPGRCETRRAASG